MRIARTDGLARKGYNDCLKTKFGGQLQVRKRYFPVRNKTLAGSRVKKRFRPGHPCPELFVRGLFAL